MRNPQGNLICPTSTPHYITNHDGTASGPWGVTCGYWRCTDDLCCMIDEEPGVYPMEKKK